MGKRIEINIAGRRLPCIATMGAMLRFREITGHEVSAMDAEGISDMCTFLYCCTAAGCNREGREFDMSLLDFCDSLEPEALTEAIEALNDGASPDDGGGKKKARR